jgi:hypothetical protein
MRKLSAASATLNQPSLFHFFMRVRLSYVTRVLEVDVYTYFFMTCVPHVATDA